jgi:hypothetical protein
MLLRLPCHADPPRSRASGNGRSHATPAPPMRSPNALVAPFARTRVQQEEYDGLTGPAARIPAETPKAVNVRLARETMEPRQTEFMSQGRPLASARSRAGSSPRRRSTSRATKPATALGPGSQAPTRPNRSRGWGYPRSFLFSRARACARGKVAGVRTTPPRFQAPNRLCIRGGGSALAPPSTPRARACAGGKSGGKHDAAAPPEEAPRPNAFLGGAVGDHGLGEPRARVRARIRGSRLRHERARPGSARRLTPGRQSRLLAERAAREGDLCELRRPNDVGPSQR